MNGIVDKLRGGDRRSIGRSNKIAREISRSPKLFAEILAAMLDPNPLVRMRAADAIEKASAIHPQLLQPHKRTILKKVAVIPQQEVRWHVAQILPRLKLTPKERDLAASILFDYLDDKSSIVKTFALQALADLAQHDSRLRKRLLPALEFLTTNGAAAMRARGRKLLPILDQR
jgi:HEAT repeat protein